MCPGREGKTISNAKGWGEKGVPGGKCDAQRRGIGKDTNWAPVQEILDSKLGGVNI